MKRIMTALLIIAGLWLSADALHEIWAQSKLDASYAERIVDENGVREGCAPFSIGEGPTALIMVHGFADSPALYRDMAADLSGKNYASTAIRLEGFAGPREEEKTATAENWKAQILKEVATASEAHENVFLVCHSLGCAVSLNAMTELKDEVDGLILMTPLFKVSSARSPVGTPEFWFSAQQNATLFTRHLVSVFEVDTQNPDTRESHPRDTVLHVNIHKQSFRSTDAALEAIDSQNLPPVLMMLAGKDQVVDNDASQRAFDKIKSEQKELLMFQESGHVIPIDFERKKATAEIDRFIKSVLQ